MRSVRLFSVLICMIISAGVEATMYQPRQLISIPTAGILPENTFSTSLHLYGNGGVILGINAGLLNRFMFGGSFGGEQVIGDGDINWQPKVEFGIKLRVIEESYTYPAIVAGFESQGEGAYYDDPKRYLVKSKGFYIVFSKNFKVLYGNLGLHIGSNYSLERTNDDTPGFFVGLDKDFFETVALNLDYDLALNDDRDKGQFGKGYGYLNVSLKYVHTSKFEFEFLFKDILRNSYQVETPIREFRLTFIFPLGSRES